MTNREFYTAILENATLPTDIRSFASDAILKMDAKNAKRAATPSKTAIANEPLKAQVLEFLGTRTSALASEIGEALGLSTAKVSSLCTQMVAEGKVTSTEIKVPKVGKRKSYAIIITAEEEVTEEE